MTWQLPRAVSEWKFGSFRSMCAVAGGTFFEPASSCSITRKITMSAKFDPLSHPILFSTPRAQSGWSAWVEHFPFGWLLLDLLRPQTLVELGTHFGDSYLCFCQGVAELKLPTRCWAVDTWTGDQHSGPYGEEVLRYLKANHDEPYGSFSTLLQKKFDEALLDFSDGQVDLLHIDGLHTYDAVRHDVDTWMPKLSRRGVIVMHDTQVKQAGFEVWRVWSEISRGLPSFEFEHGYGLGVVAIGPGVSPALLEWIEFANANREMIDPFFRAQGHRMECIRRLTALTAMMLRQGTFLRPMAEARGMVWQLPTRFSPAFANVLFYAESVTQFIEHLARERSTTPPNQTPPDQTPPDQTP